MYMNNYINRYGYYSYGNQFGNQYINQYVNQFGAKRGYLESMTKDQLVQEARKYGILVLDRKNVTKKEIINKIKKKEKEIKDREKREKELVELERIKREQEFLAYDTKGLLDALGDVGPLVPQPSKRVGPQFQQFRPSPDLFAYNPTPRTPGGSKDNRGEKGLSKIEKTRLRKQIKEEIEDDLSTSFESLKPFRK
jgi:hypothetical protein